SASSGRITTVWASADPWLTVGPKTNPTAPYGAKTARCTGNEKPVPDNRSPRGSNRKVDKYTNRYPFCGGAFSRSGTSQGPASAYWGRPYRSWHAKRALPLETAPPSSPERALGSPPRSGP